MSAATAMPGNTAATSFTHFFRPGLTDDRYLIENAQLDQHASSGRIVLLALGRRYGPFPFRASASALLWQRRSHARRASLGTLRLHRPQSGATSRPS